MAVSHADRNSGARRLAALVALACAWLLPTADGLAQPALPPFGPPPAHPAAEQAASGLPMPEIPDLPASGLTPVSYFKEEEDRLLPLLMEERNLLVDFGPEHPQVIAIRERIEAVRAYFANHVPPPCFKSAPTPVPPPLPEPVRVAAMETRPVEAPRAEVRPVAAALPMDRAAPPPAAPPKLSANEEPGKPALAAVAPAPAVVACPVPAPHQEPLPTAPAGLGDQALVLLGAAVGLTVVALLVYFVALALMARWYSKSLVRRVRSELASALAPDGRSLRRVRGRAILSVRGHELLRVRTGRFV
jgi:hypothetical protein